MEKDFNPFDLSSPPKQSTETSKGYKHAKASVNRVRFEPLLHSKVVKFLVLAGTLFVLGFASYAATEWYLLNHR